MKPEPIAVFGLKDHEIAELVNAIRDRLTDKIQGLPGCTRQIISESVVDYLESKHLSRGK